MSVSQSCTVVKFENFGGPLDIQTNWHINAGCNKIFQSLAPVLHTTALWPMEQSSVVCQSTIYCVKYRSQTLEAFAAASLICMPSFIICG